MNALPTALALSDQSVGSLAPPDLRPDLTGLTPAALAALMPTEGQPSLVRGKALWRWLRTLSALPTALPATLPEAGKDALATLASKVRLPDVTITDRIASRDGTLKWRLSCRGLPVETVLIPTPTRATVCVSSQSGCTRYCDFCATATMGFLGALTAGEIVAQVLIARQASPVPVTNVVFMGMGEPLDNLDAVLTAIDVLEHGLNLSPRHVTVSTSGVLPKLERLWSESRAAVALSLHATTQPLRDRLMPRVRRWSLDDLVAFMRQASAAEPSSKSGGRHFFIEYTLIDGVNDHDADADRLVALLDGVRARVNLIPYNPSTVTIYRRPAPERVRAFQRRILDQGLICLVRETRGDDTAAACGQLATRPDVVSSMA